MSGRDGQIARIGDLVERNAAKLRLHVNLDPEPIESEEIAAARAAGLEAARSATWRSKMPRRFVDAELTDFGGAIADRLGEWAERPAGRNLILLGPVGTGKTHAAVAAVRSAHFRRGLDVGFWAVSDLLDDLRPGGPIEDLDDVADLDRLILDDLGAERPSDWTAERLDVIVNRRWLNEAPIVATANLTAPALRQRIGDRMMSRLAGGAVVVQLSGTDRRRS